MSGPFKMKYNNSGFPFKSPMKHTKSEAGFAHPHPHTEKEDKIAKYVKKRKKQAIEVGKVNQSVSLVKPGDLKALDAAGSEAEQRYRKKK